MLEEFCRLLEDSRKILAFQLCVFLLESFGGCEELGKNSPAPRLILSHDLLPDRLILWEGSVVKSLIIYAKPAYFPGKNFCHNEGL